VLAHHERLHFLVNGLKPVIDGKIKPDQLEDLMSAELHAKELEMDHPVHALQMIGDSLPAIGIVAAVLGIINTMSSIADGPEVVGEKVAAALTGTLLGIFVAYGFVNPLAGRIRSNNASEMLYLNCIMHAVAGFAKGLAPLTAIEVSRRSLDSSVQPGADELETAVKGLGSGK
jgi:chemotaxis protein MotA